MQALVYNHEIKRFIKKIYGRSVADFFMSGIEPDRVKTSHNLI